MSTGERYVLATGEEGAYRLRIVNSVHGPDTETFLKRAGLQPGMRVADIGCGVGTISCWMAQQVGPDGFVCGIDVSEPQIRESAKSAAAAGLSNVSFQVASAYETGLESSSFDLVFCRFVLMHLTQPQQAILEMARLLKPGGILACEDGDFKRPFTEPYSLAYARLFELYRAVIHARGADPCVGPKLYRMFLSAGLPEPSVTLVQPVFVRGDAKRLPEWTLEECAPAIIEHGLADKREIDEIASELERLAQDETTLFAMAQMTQVCARL
jgi:SAM-dependent methyltransferase